MKLLPEMPMYYSMKDDESNLANAVNWAGCELSVLFFIIKIVIKIVKKIDVVMKNKILLYNINYF